MDNFVKWLDDGAFTPYGYAYDIGWGTINAIRKYKRDHKPREAGSTAENNNGNGSLMRIMPAVLYCIENNIPDDEAINIIHRVGGLTHGHIRAQIACGLYYFMAVAIVSHGGSLSERLQKGLEDGFTFYEEHLANCEELAHYDRLRDLERFAGLGEDSIRSTGYVVDALEAAVWSLATTDSFENALLKAVNLGDDTDSVGAIAGGLAGLYYQAIPKAWTDALQRREWIENLIEETEHALHSV